MAGQDVHQLVGHLFRHEAGKMSAVLTRLLGFSNIEMAEDIVQETLLQAMDSWKFNGIPQNPAGWLYTVAKNKAVDAVRKDKRIRQHQSSIANLLESEWTLTTTVGNFFLDNEIEDSQLRMMFACCHREIPYESQIALTLKTLCGLSAGEIANGFLTNEETISKRIYRAKEKIIEANISLDVPVGSDLVTRIEAVLKTLYLLFNEGYNSSHQNILIRKDLCEEAMRLCALLTRNKITNLPDAHALLALMCLQSSRFDARIDDDGKIILLNNQDRSKWNESLMKIGFFHLEHASQGERLTEYHLEAAISSCHALAKNFADTDWAKIYYLYQSLIILKPGPVTEMNMAIAFGYAETPEKGLNALLRIEGLEQNYLYHTALGDFYSRTNDTSTAVEHYHKAQSLTQSKHEAELLTKKIREIS